MGRRRAPRWGIEKEGFICVHANVVFVLNNEGRIEITGRTMAQSGVTEIRQAKRGDVLEMSWGRMTLREDGARLWEQQSGGSAEPARSAASPHCGQGQKWDAKESQSRKEEYIGEAKWDGKGSGVYSAAGKAEWQQGGSTDCRQQGVSRGMVRR